MTDGKKSPSADDADSEQIVDEVDVDDSDDDPDPDDESSAETSDPEVDMAGFTDCEEALEHAVTELERVTAERVEYLDMARRVQADFENFKRRVATQQQETTERANEVLVGELLPVLDACDSAVSQGSEDAEVIGGTLRGVLERLGLSAVDEAEVVFDPNVHDAVLSEPADGDEAELLVAEVMRTGYLWNGRVVRPAMVKVRG